jgi:hypothetical protein
MYIVGSVGSGYIVGADGRLYPVGARRDHRGDALPVVVPGRTTSRRRAPSEAIEVVRSVPVVQPSVPGGQMSIMPVDDDLFGNDPAEIALLQQQQQLQRQLAALQQQANIKTTMAQTQQAINELMYSAPGPYSKPMFGSNPPPAGAAPSTVHGSDLYTNQLTFAAAAVAAGAPIGLLFQANRASRILLLTTLTGGASFEIFSVKINGSEIRENLGQNPLPLSFFDQSNSKRVFLMPWANKNDRIEIFVRNISGAPADVKIAADDLETPHDPAMLPPGITEKLMELIVGSR